MIYDKWSDVAISAFISTIYSDFEKIGVELHKPNQERNKGFCVGMPGFLNDYSAEGACQNLSIKAILFFEFTIMQFWLILISCRNKLM